MQKVGARWYRQTNSENSPALSVCVSEPSVGVPNDFNCFLHFCILNLTVRCHSGDFLLFDAILHRFGSSKTSLVYVCGSVGYFGVHLQRCCDTRTTSGWKCVFNGPGLPLELYSNILRFAESFSWSLERSTGLSGRHFNRVDIIINLSSCDKFLYMKFMKF